MLYFLTIYSFSPKSVIRRVKISLNIKVISQFFMALDVKITFRVDGIISSVRNDSENSSFNCDNFSELIQLSYQKSF